MQTREQLSSDISERHNQLFLQVKQQQEKLVEQVDSKIESLHGKLKDELFREISVENREIFEKLEKKS